jgi:hypothetical protein
MVKMSGAVVLIADVLALLWLAKGSTIFLTLSGRRRFILGRNTERVRADGGRKA